MADTRIGRVHGNEVLGRIKVGLLYCCCHSLVSFLGTRRTILRLPGLIAKLAQSSTHEKGHRMQGRTLLPLVPLPQGLWDLEGSFYPLSPN